MNTLDELIYYCKEDQPVGALMLTGEWGSGKTYLLNNSLKDKLKDTHVLLRVSLFGVDSIEEIRKQVKSCFFQELLGSKSNISGLLNKTKRFAPMFKSTAKTISDNLPVPLNLIISGALSINAMDFIKIEPEIDKKKVVLIFDDLERSKISTNSLLGCINDYCENLHINTIIVTNEEKIKQNNNNDDIKYDEIKEKVVQRTIHHAPNYFELVSHIIDEMKIEDSMKPYIKLLKDNKESICEMFSGSYIEDETVDELISTEYSARSREERENEKNKIRELLKQRPHNIRSLKFAIQDFKRIYYLLEMKSIENKERWLFSYISYVLGVRASLINESSRYGTLFPDKEIAVLYTGYYSEKYITKGIKQWIMHGEWSQKTLDEEFEYVANRDKADSPEDKVRMYSLLDLEECDIRDGYPLFLNKAYNGEITLNEYVNLIANRCTSREYDIQLPDVDWKRIREGIYKRIDTIIKYGVGKTSYQKKISEDIKQKYTDEEINLYQIIEEFRNSDLLIFISNKKLFIELMKTDPSKAFQQTQNKRFDRFDTEMAEVTLEAFKKAHNVDKHEFIIYFNIIWKSKINTKDYKIELSENGFQGLKNGLTQLKNEYIEKSLKIAETHTNKFIETINDLIELEKQNLV